MGQRISDRERLLRSITETDLQRVILELLDTEGWVAHHETDSRKSRRGLPDLNAWHPKSGWSAHIEVKNWSRKVTAEQTMFLEAMSLLPGHWGPHSQSVHVDQELGRIVAVCRPQSQDMLIRELRAASRDLRG